MSLMYNFSHPSDEEGSLCRGSTALVSERWGVVVVWRGGYASTSHPTPPLLPNLGSHTRRGVVRTAFHPPTPPPLVQPTTAHAAFACLSFPSASIPSHPAARPASSSTRPPSPLAAGSALVCSRAACARQRRRKRLNEPPSPGAGEESELHRGRGRGRGWSRAERTDLHLVETRLGSDLPGVLPRW
jgi:hypothetical protein